MADPTPMPPADDEDIEITADEMAAMREGAVADDDDNFEIVETTEGMIDLNDGEAEQPPGPLKFHYGDGTIIDAGTMIHDDCGGIISIIDDGLVCECGANADLPAPTPSEETLQPFRDALARDTAHNVTPEQLANDPLYKPIDARDLPPEIIGQPLFDKLREARAATPEEQQAVIAAFDTVVSVLAPTCIERHVTNCECRGAARGPRP